MTDVPENANENCPGSKSEEAGKASSCAGCPNQSACASGAGRQIDPDLELIKDRLKSIKHKILVLSGKGGVGKSSVATNLARALATDEKRQVALLDVDICGPSLARMLGVEEEAVHESAEGWGTVHVNDNLSVMSIAFLLHGKNDAVIWRGPRKNQMIKKFLMDVDWGTLDYLIVDTPPGTSDEHISLVQYLQQTGGLDGAILVTTPQEVSLQDVRKEASFCQKTDVKIIGVVENMSAFVCPCCSTATPLFPRTTGGADAMCKEMSLQLLAALPLDPRMADCVDTGEDFLEKYPDSPLSKAFISLSDRLTTS